jgi:L-alanine-DL-glutamate epimerase-like enolase superfamily enzyme
MELSHYRYDLMLRHTFTISRSSRKTVPVIIIEFVKDGITAYGEASPNIRYDETPESVEAFLQKIDPKRLADPFQLKEINNYLDSVASGNPSAKCAIDIAMHDWIGKKLDTPLYRFFGADKNRIPISTLTIGIDTVEDVIQRVKDANEYPVLKIKMGLPNDEEIIRAVRSVTNKPLRVDANEGWKSKEEALEKIKWLKGQNVELVEQPLPAAQIEDAIWLHERTTLPIVADEALASHDLATLSNAYDGINVKLQKNGGLLKARELILSARVRKMKVMLGCMIETSVGITAAAHLSPFADWVDLDGNVLIANDPFRGVANEHGKLLLSEEAGLGVKKIL